MRGPAFRNARERSGLTREEIAARCNVDAREVAAWEHGQVPRRHRSKVEVAIWEAERDSALERSRFPACEWIGEWESRPISERDADSLVQHLEGCDLCEARRTYVEANVRPPPIAGSIPERFFGLLGRLPGWQRSAMGGALIVTLMGGIGVVALLARSVLAFDLAAFGMAIGLLILLVVSGGAGGLVHHLTTPVRARGRGGHYLSWILVVYGYLATALTLLGLAAALSGGARRTAREAGMEVGVAELVAFLLVGALFGLVAGHMTREKKATEPTPPKPDRGALTLPNILSAIIILIAVGGRLLLAYLGPMDAEDVRKELPALQQAAREHPEDPEAQRKLAWALVQLEHRTEALPALQRAVLLNPKDADLRYSLGWHLSQAGRHGEAVTALREAVRLDPKHMDASWTLGWSLYQLERDSEAEAAYRQAVELAPDDPRIRYELGLVLRDQAKYDQSILEFRRAIRADSANLTYRYDLAVVYMRNGDLAQAIEQLEKMREFDPSNPRVWAEIGRIAHMKGDHPRAAQAFARADELDSSYFDSHRNLREMWEASKKGRYVGATNPG